MPDSESLAFDKVHGAKYFTKIVALSMQMLDKKPAEEPVDSVEEDVAEYELGD